MSIVYVVQDQHRWDNRLNKLVPKFDLSSAEKFGELRYLLSPKAAPFASVGVIKELREKLAGYREEDYLLLIGNPALIGFVVAIAGDQTENGVLRLLQFSGKEQSYIPINAVLFPD